MEREDILSHWCWAWLGLIKTSCLSGKKNFKVKTEIVETSDLTNITGERGRSYTETKT